MQKPYPCLWFDTEAEDARKFYLSVFKNSKKGATTYYGDYHPSRKGTVLTAMFEKSERYMQAIMTMKKLDIAKLKKAYDGK